MEELDRQIFELQRLAINNKLGKLACSIGCVNFCNDFVVGMGVLYKEVDDGAEGDRCCVTSCEPGTD